MVNREAERKRLVEVISKIQCRNSECAKSCSDFSSVALFDEDVEILADHLLDNGIVVPPVKVGQEVWVIVDGFRNPMQGYISRFSLWQDCEEIVVRVIGYLLQSYQIKDIGKTVFTSREDAEKALEGSGER